MVAFLGDGTLTSRQLIEAHLARIERVNPRLNAFSQIFDDQALAQSRVPQPGPLSGIPVTVKDSFDIAGFPTICGNSTRTQAIATTDANAVARLKAAGAIILGKTNVPDLVSSYETDNYVTGLTRNPWNLDFTPGGSSGGEAAAIASCCSPGGIASDGGGSIRIPAHFCGIAGFKPTHRRIGAGGMFPPCVGPASLCTAPGVMARNVADTRLLFQVLQGFDPHDSESFPASDQPVHKPKIGLLRQFYKIPVHPDIALALDAAANMLREAGYTVEEFTLQGLERAPNTWAFFFAELGLIQTRALLAGNESEAHWTITETLRDAPIPDANAVLAAYAERERLRILTLEQMSQYPILLTPPSSIPAFKPRERRWPIGDKPLGLFAAMAHATTWNLLGFPALVLPVRHTELDLPVGIQLVGRPFADETVLAAGEALEAVRGAFPYPQL